MKKNHQQSGGMIGLEVERTNEISYSLHFDCCGILRHTLYATYTCSVHFNNWSYERLIL